MTPRRPTSCCRLCGAASYRPVIARDAAGAMTHTGLYRCSGCSVVFADPKAWREGGPEELPPTIAPAKLKSTHQALTARPAVPEGPNLKTYGLVPGRAPNTG